MAPPSTSACPAPDALARLAEGRVSALERSGLEGHLARCPLCHAIVGGLARAQGRALPAPRQAPAREPAESEGAPARARSLGWVPWAIHAALALGVGLAGWWLLG